MASNASEAIMPMAVTANAATPPDGVMVDSDEPTNQQGRNRHHRYTHEQIQELETFFRVCPYPNENQRNELSRALELEPNQVKFWFQNKRTQLKALNEHEYNLQLHKEYEKLQEENLQYKIALACIRCRQCGVPCINGFVVEEHQLKLENTRLRNQIYRISSIATRFRFGMMSLLPMQNEAPSEVSFTTIPPSFGEVVKIYGNNDVEKPVITELALSAMNELLQMTQLKEPLWVSSVNPNIVVLNKEVYGRLCSKGRSIAIANPTAGFKTEASRESACVKINRIQLVDAFMNVDRWATMFSNIVSRAVTVGVISIGAAGNYDRALQVDRWATMFSNIVSRAVTVGVISIGAAGNYDRALQVKITNGTWAIVDFSIDRYLCMDPIDKCMRRPSGCLIQEVPNECTKVTWVEHIEVDNDDNEVVSIYEALLNSDMAFGAKRWVSTLHQRCQRTACTMSLITPPANENLVITPNGKKSTFKLVERMVNNYMSVVSCSVPLQWQILWAGADNVRIMTKKVLNEAGIPSGVHLSAATSFWLPIEPKRVFDFLNDKHQRAKWDIFSSSCALTEVAHIIYGGEIENSVSLFRVENPSMSNTMILQETSSSSTGSYIIYAPVETSDMKLVSQGGDSKQIPLLPCGFVILPDGRPPETGSKTGSSDGSLLTIVFQLLVDSIPTTKLSPESVTMINQLTIETVEKITSCLF
ncbi:homeobox-leucine zipper protein ROC1-like [Ipomoea triloba]|uniref:homeobox-leucine zipper protein ROC1-like n=1 Tax=Ipomoea triloba TaxID=35885 RepID=UPI00125DF717|nr:homeobox-leucine zipper protein ROC1-like [Ipomoea triloba]